MCAKASALDHCWPEEIDNQKSELNSCCLAIYVKFNLTGQVWSKLPAFAPGIIFTITQI